MNARNAAEPESARTLVITREYPAPTRLVFAAYSQREHLLEWFGPKGYPLSLCEVDFRVGGRFRFQMTGPDGEKGPLFGGEYLEIVPDQKIVYDNGFFDAGAERMLVTVTFAEQAGQTVLTMSTLFSSRKAYDEHVALGFVEGCNSAFDNMAELLARLQR